MLPAQGLLSQPSVITHLPSPRVQPEKGDTDSSGCQPGRDFSVGAEEEADFILNPKR